MIPTIVHTDTIPPGTCAKPRPVETINALRSPGGEVPAADYCNKANSATNKLENK
jgi:hypothetical protein